LIIAAVNSSRSERLSLRLGFFAVGRTLLTLARWARYYKHNEVGIQNEKKHIHLSNHRALSLVPVLCSDASSRGFRVSIQEEKRNWVTTHHAYDGKNKVARCMERPTKERHLKAQSSFLGKVPYEHLDLCSGGKLGIFSQCGISLLSTAIEPLEICEPEPACLVILGKSGGCQRLEMPFCQSGEVKLKLCRVDILCLELVDDVASPIFSTVIAGDDGGGRHQLWCD